MTDDFPKDEQEFMIPEDAFALEENEGDVWNEPPSSEDGFSDSESGQEEYQDPEEIHEEYEDSGEMHEDEIQETSSDNHVEEGAVDKGRGKVVLFGLVGAGILFVGGLTYLQLDQPEGGSSLVSLVQTTEVGHVPPKENSNAIVDSEVTPTTAETDLALLYQVAKQQEIHSEGKNLFGKEDKGENPSTQEEKERSTNIILHDNSADIIPSSPLPQEAVTMPVQKPDLQIAKIETIQVKPAASAEMTPQFQEMESKIRKLELDLLEARKAQEEVEEKLAEAEKRPVPAPVIENNQSELLAKVEARLAARDKELEVARKRMSEVMSENDELSQKVESMKQKLSSATQVEKQLKKKLVKTEEEKTKIQAEKKEVVTVVEKEMPPQPLIDTSLKENPLNLVPLAPDSLMKEEAEQAKQEEPVKQEEHVLTLPVLKADFLVLRAATPKAAWVAQSKTSLDLKKIEIGDVLPQIGKVILIRQKDNKWEVVGTAGVLR